ncbi:MAG: response regulator [Syntrophomonadaceae bacterium]|nr:response regulator [Syntrophomonadaceae bacterium]
MGYRLLVVDDQKGIRRLLQELFQREGFEVEVAADGMEAIELVKSGVPDVILMDMKMPRMNGLEASETILKMNQDVAIIMMTAYGEIEMMKKAVEVGVKKYITKPFDIIVLRDMVKETLARGFQAG